MTTYEEWRVTGDPGQGFPPYTFIWSPFRNPHLGDDPEAGAQPTEAARREIAYLTRHATDPLLAPAERAMALLTIHQRRDVGSCLCGWAELGKSHAGHQADALARAGLLVQRAEEHGEVCR